MALRQTDRRRRFDLKAAAVRAEVLFDPDGGQVGKLVTDPVTGDLRIEHWPNSRLKCMRVRYSPTVSWVRYGGPGSAVTPRGLTRCCNAVACPVCMQARLLEAGDELRNAVAGWHDARPGELRCFLLTLTARHHQWTDEERLRDAIQESWRELWQGRDAQQFKEDVGLAGWCRRTEVNYGENGAHPHVHTVLVFHEHKTPEELEAIRRWFLGRWSAALERRGFDCNDANGANIVLADREGQYLVKMGLGLALELTATDTKEAATGSRTPLKVLEDWAEHRRPEDGRLWQRHCRTWRGRRMLEFSRGRLAAWRSVRPAAPELALGSPEPAVVATTSGPDWDAVPFRERYAANVDGREVAEAKEHQQDFVGWAEQQCTRLGLEPPAGLSGGPVDLRPKPRRLLELYAVAEAREPPEDTWRPPGWWVDIYSNTRSLDVLGRPP